MLIRGSAALVLPSIDAWNTQPYDHNVELDSRLNDEVQRLVNIVASAQSTLERSRQLHICAKEFVHVV
jgi:hypothetical protein